jgi:HD superfamily phosphohydrolase
MTTGTTIAVLTFHDRLYGALNLPDIVRELAMTCPVILRLREIRQPNIAFLSHPSFANVDRYEHSLGVAHLAWRWARRNGLPRDLATAITIAALYHDGATPAFGHLFEEFLSRFGFDHEKTLANVVIGNSGIPGQADAQVFLGYPCRLRQVLASTDDPASPLTPFQIMRLAQGEGVFGRLLKGAIDLDNIDNVIRACTFMGILSKEQQLHPYEVADALVLENDSVKIDASRVYAVQAWAKLRETLYKAILDNPFEFRSQTTLKWAIEESVRDDPTLRSPRAWCLTEPELVFEHLHRNKFSRELVRRVRLARPPEILFSAWLEDVSPLVGTGSETITEKLVESLQQLTNMEVYINFYADKRKREFDLDPSSQLGLWGTSSPHAHAQADENPISKMGTRGIVGGIALSRTVRRACAGRGNSVGANNGRNGSDLAIKSFSADSLQKEVESAIGQRPVAFSTNWLGTSPQHVPQPMDPQLALFD